MKLTTAGAGRILLVGAGPASNDLAGLLGPPDWICQRSESTAGILLQLRLEPQIDIVLLVPDADIRPYTELCRQIKFDTRTAFISVIVASPAECAVQRADVFAAGADDCLQLPASPAEIVLRLSNLCRVKRATDSLEDATAVITSLANAIEGRDFYTRGHVERVADYAVELGRRVGVPDTDLPVLHIGGIVHDIGKVAVPDHILNKPGSLTPEEWELVRRHPLVGYDILQPLRTFRSVLPLVRWHHERPNGTGYPDGLSGQELPLLTRIVAVADVLDALSTARSYRPAFSAEKCRQILITGADKGDLDADLVTALLEIWGDTAVGRVAAVATSGFAPQP